MDKEISFTRLAPAWAGERVPGSREACLVIAGRGGLIEPSHVLSTRPGTDSFPEVEEMSTGASQVHLGFALFHSILSIRLLDKG